MYTETDDILLCLYCRLLCCVAVVNSTMLRLQPQQASWLPCRVSCFLACVSFGLQFAVLILASWLLCLQPVSLRRAVWHRVYSMYNFIDGIAFNNTVVVLSVMPQAVKSQSFSGVYVAYFQRSISMREFQTDASSEGW